MLVAAQEEVDAVRMEELRVCQWGGRQRGVRCGRSGRQGAWSDRRPLTGRPVRLLHPEALSKGGEQEQSALKRGGWQRASCFPPPPPCLVAQGDEPRRDAAIYGREVSGQPRVLGSDASRVCRWRGRRG